MSWSSTKRQIFIVDDDESIGRALSLLLGTYGFKVKTFLNAEQFLKWVPKKARGCLLLDYHLPGWNGQETQRRLRASGSKLPIVMITADKDESLKAEILKAGAVGFLQKPFNDKDLVAALSRAFESP